MTEYVYVRPRPGGRVRMPDREFRPMDAAGATVPRIDYYERLIIAGDLVICDAPAAEPDVTGAAAPEAVPEPLPLDQSSADQPRAPRSSKEK